MDKELLTRQFGKEQIRKRKGKGNMVYFYVTVETVIERLNEALDTWDFKVGEPQIIGEEKKEVIIQGTLMTPIGTRSTYGGDEIINSITDAVKSAASDSLKRCSFLLGVPCIFKTTLSQNNIIHEHIVNSEQDDEQKEVVTQQEKFNLQCEMCDSPVSVSIRNFSQRTFHKVLCLSCQNRQRQAASR